MLEQMQESPRTGTGGHLAAPRRGSDQGEVPLLPSFMLPTSPLPAATMLMPPPPPRSPQPSSCSHLGGTQDAAPAIGYISRVSFHRDHTALGHHSTDQASQPPKSHPLTPH